MASVIGLLRAPSEGEWALLGRLGPPECPRAYGIVPNSPQWVLDGLRGLLNRATQGCPIMLYYMILYYAAS